MGTNYYWQSDPCKACNHVQERLHIGKSSAGWCFSLHIIPEIGIMNLVDWRKKWDSYNGQIVDEYGAAVTADEMLLRIIERKGREWDNYAWYGYSNEQDFHQRNGSERGPNGLLRHRIGPFCSGHGEGTWDYMIGEFS